MFHWVKQEAAGKVFLLPLLNILTVLFIRNNCRLASPRKDCLLSFVKRNFLICQNGKRPIHGFSSNLQAEKPHPSNKILRQD